VTDFFIEVFVTVCLFLGCFFFSLISLLAAFDAANIYPAAFCFNSADVFLILLSIGVLNV
jgi:hypothetical protein